MNMNTRTKIKAGTKYLNKTSNFTWMPNIIKIYADSKVNIN